MFGYGSYTRYDIVLQLQSQIISANITVRFKLWQAFHVRIISTNFKSIVNIYLLG